MIKRLCAISGVLVLVVLLSACGAAAGSNTGGNTGNAGSQTSNTVQVTEIEYKIDSSVTSFMPGTTYHFVVTNIGQTAHEFMIMPKSEGDMSGMPMSNMDKMALVAIDNIQPGATKTFTFTFPASVANAYPQFACYLPGHYEAGMKLSVTVK